MKIIVNIAYALLEGDACDFELFKCDSLGFLADFEFEALFLGKMLGKRAVFPVKIGREQDSNAV